jgi:hypothetical protein
VVVVLARMPLADARRLGERFFGQIDVIVPRAAATGGYGLIHPEHGKALYLVCENRGRALGVARIALADGAVERIVGEEMSLSKDVSIDPAVAAMTEELRNNVSRVRKVSAAERLVHTRSDPQGHYYVGGAACRGCHGREAGIWGRSAHARAYASVRTEDAETPDAACVRCHVTGGGEPAGFRGDEGDLVNLVNVQCEACHGRGSRHARDGTYAATLREETCLRCHDEDNSPGFDLAEYWQRIAH